MPQEIENKSEICEHCGKKRLRGSLTQWIFSADSCSCATPTKERALNVCPLCGRRQKIRTGTITQWIFNHEQCTCKAEHTPLETSCIPADDLIAGSPYEFIGIAGTGGAATVYKAHSKKLAKYVAIKAITPSNDDLFDADKFMQEAKVISKLQHPNILAILDFGTMRDGRSYLVTEWVEGCSLAEYIERYGVLSTNAAEEVFCAVLDGLSHAHRRSIIHRDVKPGNIMLAKSEHGWIVKIIDFGTAKDTLGDQSHTRIEDLAISPFYASPERIKGIPVDDRADLYSLGCTLYEALTGRPPFTGKPMVVAMRHQNEAPPTLSEGARELVFPQYFEDIVSRLLAKAPEERFANAIAAKSAIKARKRLSPIAPNNSKTFQTDLAEPRSAITPLLSTVLIVSSCVAFAALFTYAIYTALFTDSEPLPFLSRPNSTKKRHIDSGVAGFDTVKLSLDNGAITWQEIAGDQLDKTPDSIDFAFVSVTGPFSESALRTLCKHKTLKGLSVQNTSLTPNLLKIVTDTAPTLQGLFIGQNPALKDADLLTLEKLPKLRHLSLDRGTFTDKAIESVLYLKSLRVLQLSGLANFKGTTLGTLKSLPELKSLDLKNTILSTEGWNQLASLTQLAGLNLSGTGLNDKTVKPLKKLQAIRMDISRNPITKQGLTTLLGISSLTRIYAIDCKIPKVPNDSVYTSTNQSGVIKLLTDKPINEPGSLPMALMRGSGGDPCLLPERKTYE